MKSFLAAPLPGRAEPGVAVVHVHSTGTVQDAYLPILPGLTYRIVPFVGRDLDCTSGEMAIEARTGASAGADFFYSRTFLKRKKYLELESSFVVPCGSAATREKFYAVTKQMMRSGYPLDGAFVRRFPELVRGWPSSVGTENLERSSSQAEFAVVVHVYYMDVWAEIATALRQLEQTFDVHVTTPFGEPVWISQIKAHFPRCHVHVFENKGRDIAPFLMLLEQGILDAYGYICKLHTKKAADGGRNPLSGVIWRNRLLFDLVARQGAVREILSSFARDPGLGMVGSGAYRFPNKMCNERISWGANRARYAQLCDRLGVPERASKLDFFCGSMFWVRRTALEPLRSLGLLPEFGAESGLLDGALEHAVERIFTVSADAVAMTAKSIDRQ